MSAITWTTPTLPILIKGGNILDDNCRVFITIGQGKNILTLEPISATSTETGVLVEIHFTQIQSGGFSPGIANVQANVIDSNGYRAASLYETINLGSNLLKEVISYV